MGKIRFNSPKGIIVLFSVLCLVALSSRFVNIDTQGILVDETWVVPNTFLHFGEESIFPKLFTYPQFQALEASRQEMVRKIYFLHPVFQVAAYQASDVHPPFFHILNYFWGRSFGYEVATIRLPAAIYFLLTFFAVFWVFRVQAIDWKISSLTLFFMALSPLYLFFSNFARPYTLLMLLGVLSSYFAYELVRSGFRKPLLFILYIFTAVASLYTHYYAVFVVGSQGLYFIMESYLGQSLRRHIGRILLIEAMVVLLFLPWALVMVYQFTQRFHKIESGFDALNLNTIWELLLSFGMGYSRSDLYTPLNIIVSLILFALFIRGTIYLWGRRSEPAMRFWLFYLAAPFTLLVIFNLAKSVFTVRNCLIIYIPYLAACSFGLMQIRRFATRAGIFVLLGGVGLYFVYHGLSYGNTKGPGAMEDWKSTASFVKTLKRNLPVYVYHPSYRDPLYYYIPDAKRILGLPPEALNRGPEEKEYFLVLMKPEEGSVEDKIAREIPFLNDRERFAVSRLNQFPHIFVYAVERLESRGL